MAALRLPCESVFFSSRRRHTRFDCDWSSDVCSSDLHYLHHDRGGVPFADPGELAGRLVAAASHTGIGLTLLPTFYAHGRFCGAAPTLRQRRFIHDPERLPRIVEGSPQAVRTLTRALLGVAP